MGEHHVVPLEVPVQQWVVPVVTALISTVGAFVSVWYARLAARAERLATAEDLATRFREPLLQAVFNLETRIFNIVELDFFGRFLGATSTSDEREYAELNTLYVFAQYFCWVEIVRRESQFLDPRSVERNRIVAHALEGVRDTFADSRRISDRDFRLFRGEQRALGEVMLVPVTAPQDGAPRWECLGYAPFVRALDDPQVARWFRRLRTDITEAASSRRLPSDRLRLVQRGLMDIVDALDPQARQIPQPLRRRLEPPPEDGTARHASRVGGAGE